MTDTLRPNAVDPDALPEPGVAEGQTGDNLRWTAFKSTAAQIGGRGVIAVARLVVAASIARGFGRTVFGEYALLFGILSLAEWIVDFGTVELAVREICRDRSRQTMELRLLAALKIVQIPLAILAAAIVLFAMRYPQPIIRAGLVGSIGVVFLGGVLVYLALFRARLTMERAAAAESISVIAMIGFIFIAHRAGGGLIAVMLCHVAGRAVFFATCFLLGRREFKPSVSGASRVQVAARLRGAVAIGIVGSLMLVYEALDLLLISRFAPMGDLAHYSAAQRLLSPILLACGSIAGTLYAVAASYWPANRDSFIAACQRGVDTSLLLAGLSLSSLIAGAFFYLRLLSRDLVGAVPILQVLGVLCFVKAISVTIGPLLYVIDAQKTAMRLMAIAAVAKAIAIAAVVGHFGVMGVAIAALVIEIAFVTVPASVVLWRRAQFKLRWSRVAAFAAVTAIAVLIAMRLPPGPFHFLPGLAAPLIYAPLAMIAGGIRPASLWRSLRNQT